MDWHPELETRCTECIRWVKSHEYASHLEMHQIAEQTWRQKRWEKLKKRQEKHVSNQSQEGRPQDENGGQQRIT